MELFDTHFHWEKDLSPETIASEANDNSVKYLACIGGDYTSSLDAMDFSNKVKNSCFSVGVHPHCAEKGKWELDKFRELLKHDKCKAVGEVGLDFYYENSTRDAQLEVFEDFCNLSSQFSKPLIIHSRDKENSFESYSLIYEILKKYITRIPSFVIHCYTGNLFWLNKFLELGAYIGITGIVTFPKAQNVRELIHSIPDDRLLLETDSPYLAPKLFRGKTNYPKYLKYIAIEVSSLKNISIDKIAEITTYNALRFYNWHDENKY